MTPHPASSEIRRRSMLCAIPLGIGLMAAVDEILFHQILQWHHFFDRATPAIGVLSDGLLHAGELFATVFGAIMLIRLARAGRLAVRQAWAGGLLGAGGFQLFDGIISHKVLRIHQIRYDVDLLWYDLSWNGIAVLLILAGLMVWRRGQPTGGG
ncbi:DUF2243 domain-containing protein [Halopseudomonas pertucinogena]|nr:DUF2243 domain-containing protein [Halopseudomonas pertucinogena]